MVSVSCSKKTTFDPNKVDSFVFGSAYGMCAGDCAKFFAIANQQLFPDTMAYYTGFTGFSSTHLPDAKYQLAKQLVDEFPTYFINHPNTTFGCPDCADQGGIYIELKENGRVKKWSIDTDVSKQPAETKDYIAKLRTVLRQL